MIILLGTAYFVFASAYDFVAFCELASFASRLESVCIYG
jgi:hypothetical protein